MAFRLDRKLAHYRRNPHLRRRYQRAWRARKRRAAEIASAKALLLMLHQIRAAGVTRPVPGNRQGFDSWSARP